MRQKLFSSEFWVPGAALSDYQIWFSKREERPVNRNYNNLFSVVWVQPCNRENQLKKKKKKSKWIKANQLTGGRKRSCPDTWQYWRTGLWVRHQLLLLVLLLALYTNIRSLFGSLFWKGDLSLVSCFLIPTLSCSVTDTLWLYRLVESTNEDKRFYFHYSLVRLSWLPQSWDPLQLNQLMHFSSEVDPLLVFKED